MSGRVIVAALGLTALAGCAWAGTPWMAMVSAALLLLSGCGRASAELDAGSHEAQSFDGGPCTQPYPYRFCDAGFIDSSTCEGPCDVQNYVCGAGLYFFDCGGGTCVDALVSNCPPAVDAGPPDAGSPDAGACYTTYTGLFCFDGHLDSGVCNVPCAVQNFTCPGSVFNICDDGSCVVGVCPTPDAGAVDSGCMQQVTQPYCDAGYLDTLTCELSCPVQNAFCDWNQVGFTDCGNGTCVNGGSCPYPDGGVCMDTQQTTYCDAGFIDTGVCYVPCAPNFFCSSGQSWADCGSGTCVDLSITPSCPIDGGALDSGA